MASIIKYRKELLIHLSKPELWAKTRPIAEPNRRLLYRLDHVFAAPDGGHPSARDLNQPKRAH
jgi:hypothetical protein